MDLAFSRGATRVRCWAVHRRV
ncbi:MAG TPA: hypothetical protein DCL34_13830 [Erythrobacter sp.]|nr:hypothetical protein [Erythrobacter sp.]